ncbi:unnamed protein product [Periconia digitata]|uniref:DNA 3'-5' helicase n=1 Tax=Periconia digitata TaxID=1303443 RepID=A0A9W4UAN8_9PLEO|nr:unnamed protein product [Periconia digitata]
MAENHPHSLFPLDDTSASQRYPVLQTRFRQFPQAVPPRDRYRTYRRDGGDAVEDCVEDDWGEEETMQFDAFDEQILQKSMEDRKKKAEKGLARLSFTPGYGSSSYRPRDSIVGGDSTDSRQIYQQQQLARRDLSRFAFNAADLPETSSDAQCEHSSSPAFRASQRRVEQEYDFPGQPHKSQHASEHETTHETEDYQARGDLYDTNQSTSRPLPNSTRNATALQHKPSAPVCQGIPLVFVSELPSRLRTIFPYPNFNAVQSKCFEAVYKTDNNFVLAAPTGSGKTVILELAICRAISTNTVDQYKIVYQAPTKALCSERQRDWEKKFSPAGLNCVELTGDSDARDLKNVQSANIIITTPEKWDSITRKWNDHEKLMRLIKLFLIDEVHILKEDRGATLEVVVSRMKTIGTNVRFVALSATVPNFNDVATWLGKSSATPNEAAIHEKFGEEFRPVRLQKHVRGYTSNNPNEFAFEKVIDSNLTSVIKKYSERKPMMIFCSTRKSTATTAQKLASWWASSGPNDRMWNAPSTSLAFRDKDLQSCATSGVAFHHAGISLEDRVAVEDAFLKNFISVICCTSTLAVGVNLPCHMVIIKNTVFYTPSMGTQEYPDLDIMQMLGRAGRPQFEDSAIAVIMTRQAKVARYEKMAIGEEVLESTLHQNLVDHLNAEICLGTIKDLLSANRWLTSTFLYVRLNRNPRYYQLHGSASGQTTDEQLNEICYRDISLLREHQLMVGEENFHSTEFGQAMARYYVHFKSMVIFMGLPRKAAISEILSAIAQASEFEEIRFRQGEKALYKHINKSVVMRFPIPVDLALSPHKISLLIQSVLGAADIPWDGDFGKHRQQYNTEANSVFRSLTRLVRCIIDCQIVQEDAVSINNALLLERSIAARVWDDSPLQMKQIDKIGIVGVRKLASAGIRSIEELECTEPHRIESIIGRNPPFGLSIIEQLKTFPKLRISLSLQANSISKTPNGVKVTIKADVGFINDKVPEFFNSKSIYVCMLAETSDGRKVHFARTSSRQLGRGQMMNFSTLLTSPNLRINAYLMCDGIAGTQRCASVTPKIAPSMFPSNNDSHDTLSPGPPNRPTSNMALRRTESTTHVKKRPPTAEEYDDGIDDEELMKASSYDLDFDHIENFANTADTLTRNNTAKNACSTKNSRIKPNYHPQDDGHEPKQLENGKWACNHPCKNKQACKHLCCKEGMDKPPKKSAPKHSPSEDLNSKSSSNVQEMHKPKSIQTKLQISPTKRQGSNSIAQIDLTQPSKKMKPEISKHSKSSEARPKDFQKRDIRSSLSSLTQKKPRYCYGEGGDYKLSFMDNSKDSSSSDYGDMDLDEHFSRALAHTGQGHDHHTKSNLQDHHADVNNKFPGGTESFAALDEHQSEAFGDDDSVFNGALMNLSEDPDSIYLNPGGDTKANGNDFDDELGLGLDLDAEMGFEDNANAEPGESFVLPHYKQNSSRIADGVMHPKAARMPFLVETSSPRPSFTAINTVEEGQKHGPSEHIETNLETSRRPASREKHQEPNQNEESREKKLVEENAALVSNLPAPEAHQGLDSWLLEEFGDVVEIVDE